MPLLYHFVFIFAPFFLSLLFGFLQTKRGYPFTPFLKYALFWFMFSVTVSLFSTFFIDNWKCVRFHAPPSYESIQPIDPDEG